MIRGFDISDNNGYLDDSFWQDAVNQNMKFVYIRASWGNGHADEGFQYNVAKAHEYGLIVGSYHYDYSLTPDATAVHARRCAEIIAETGVLLELPVFFDLEDADGWKERNGYDFTGETATAQCMAWLENIGLHSGVYAPYSWLEEKVQDSDGYGRGTINWRALGCSVWNAQWGRTDDLGGFVWQDTDKLIIGGRKVDGDYMYDHSFFD